jgi:transposase-like protein
MDVASFTCANCGKSYEKEIGCARYRADAFCKNCEYSFSVDVSSLIKDSGRDKINVVCPRCARGTAAIARKIETNVSRWLEIKNGADPHFGYPLYYQSVFKGEVIWALNSEHLRYLIDYVSAELRYDSPKQYGDKSQSDHLPTFMKLAKNRAGVLKTLNKMLTL